MKPTQVEIKPEDLPHYTVEDYMQWEGDWELIRGIPFAMMPSPVIRHQEISVEIITQLRMQLENCPHCHVIPAVDWKISDDTVVQPDVLAICDEIDTCWLEPNHLPMMIFEILSPSTSKKDMGIKYRLYEEAGVKYYCIVDPHKTSVSVFVIKKDKYGDGDEMHDGRMRFDLEPCEIELDFGKIFKRLKNSQSPSPPS